MLTNDVKFLNMETKKIKHHHLRNEKGKKILLHKYP